MRRFLFNLVLLLSIAAATLLMMGYVWQWEVNVWGRQTARPAANRALANQAVANKPLVNKPLVNKSGQIVDFRFGAGVGRVVLYFQAWPIPASATQPITGVTSGVITRQVLNGQPFGIDTRSRLRAPEWRRSVWDFDAHRLPLPGLTTSWIFACPIWCLLLPCLLFPMIWWRKRGAKVVRGFAVRQNDGVHGYSVYEADRQAIDPM